MGWLAKLFVGPVFDTLGSVVGGWLERKKIAAVTETTIALKKQEVITSQATADITWDQTMADGSKDSWKDEYWTIILSIPMIGAFIPGMDVYVLNGFTVLASTPDEYKIFLGTAIAAAFGRSELIKITRKWKSMDK